jgi:hypothetical protein
MAKKIENFIAPLFAKHNRPYNGSLRRRYDRMVNTLLASGLFVVEFTQPGMSWKSEDRKQQWNMRVRVPAVKKVYSRYIKSSIDPFDVLSLIGYVLQKDEVRAVIPSYVDLDSRCSRCKGQEVPGFIRMFSHVCNGICFECYGSGYNPKFKPVVEIESPK